MRKRALVILADGFEEIEAVAPIDVLRRGGVDVTVAGLSNINIPGARNLLIHCGSTLAQAGVDYDAVILPGGGNGAQNLARSKEVAALVRDFSAKGKLIAAICASPALVLAPLGILDNKSATCFPGMENSFNKSTIHREDPVVVDGNIITSRGPGTALAFSFAILEMLADKTIADKVRSAMLL